MWETSLTPFKDKLDMKMLLRHPHHPYFALDKISFSPYIHRELPNNDRFLSRFRVTTSTIPYCEVTVGSKIEYGMKKEERESWERAETVTKKMNECIDATSPFEAGLCAPPLPSSFGYHLTFCSLEELSKHVIVARNAFEVYIAWTVYRVLCADNGGVFSN